MAIFPIAYQGGSGDVLTGLAAGLLARGYSPSAAAHSPYRKFIIHAMRQLRAFWGILAWMMPAKTLHHPRKGSSQVVVAAYGVDDEFAVRRMP